MFKQLPTDGSFVSVTLLFSLLLVLMMVFDVQNAKSHCLHFSLGLLAQHIKAYKLQQVNLGDPLNRRKIDAQKTAFKNRIASA